MSISGVPAAILAASRFLRFARNWVISATRVFTWRVTNRFKGTARVKSFWISPHLGVCLLIVCAGACCWFSFDIPAPGAAVAVLGAVAGIVGLRRMDEPEKVCWMFAMFWLLFIEIKSIQKDRTQNETERRHARAEELQKFTEIAQRLTTNIDNGQKQFDATMARTSDVLRATQKAIHVASEAVDSAIGGDSYCYVIFESTSLERRSAIPVFVASGKYPLYDVKARVVDLEALQQKMRSGRITPFEAVGVSTRVIDLGNLGTESSKVAQEALIQLDPNATSVSLNIFFSARNGFWDELLRYRLVAGKWLKAYQVFNEHHGKKSVIRLTHVDKDFPEPSTAFK